MEANCPISLLVEDRTKQEHCAIFAIPIWKKLLDIEAIPMSHGIRDDNLLTATQGHGGRKSLRCLMSPVPVEAKYPISIHITLSEAHNDAFPHHV